MTARHISEVLPDADAMRSRGNLPRRIRTTCEQYAGEVFRWDDSRGVFAAESGRDLVALPWMVRGLFGITFHAVADHKPNNHIREFADATA